VQLQVNTSRDNGRSASLEYKLRRAARMLEEKLGGSLVVKAYMLAKKAVILANTSDRLEVLVPSQRLTGMSRERVESYLDLYRLLVDHEYALTMAKTGRLPETQQWYRVVLEASGEASCTCPDHVYRKKICKHIVAALMLAVALNRRKLVEKLLAKIDRADRRL